MSKQKRFSKRPFWENDFEKKKIILFELIFHPKWFFQKTFSLFCRFVFKKTVNEIFLFWIEIQPDISISFLVVSSPLNPVWPLLERLRQKPFDQMMEARSVGMILPQVVIIEHNWTLLKTNWKYKHFWKKRLGHNWA